MTARALLKFQAPDYYGCAHVSALWKWGPRASKSDLNEIVSFGCFVNSCFPLEKAWVLVEISLDDLLSREHTPLGKQLFSDFQNYFKQCILSCTCIVLCGCLVHIS